MYMNVIKPLVLTCAGVLGIAGIVQAQQATTPPVVPPPVSASGPCPIGFRDSAKARDWQVRVDNAHALADTVQKRDALYALVKEALGSETDVRIAANKFPTQPNPADYMPYPVVNFDVNLGGKRDSGSSYFFTTRDAAYVVLGPGSIHSRGPVTTQNNTDHERYHVERHWGDSRPVMDREVEVWTHIFTTTFHSDYPYRLLWNPLMSAYENASPAERAITLHELVKYYQNPPAEIGSGCVDEFRAEYRGWIERRVTDEKLAWRQLITDLQRGLDLPVVTPAPPGSK